MLGFGSIAETAISEVPEQDLVSIETDLSLENLPVFPVGTLFYRAEMGEDFGGTPISVVLERIGLTIEGFDRSGNIRSNPRSVKLLREIWPLVRGEVGTVIEVFCGVQRTPEDAIFWHGPYSFTVGTSVSVQPLLEGVYHSVRFRSTGQPAWDMLSYILDIEPTGEVL